MTDYIVLAILVIVIGSAVAYIIREKKRGTKCIGCPNGANCGGTCKSCGGSCNCGTDETKI